MKVVGLTGSIGMGKSTTANMFAARGVPVFDADQTVRDLQMRDGEALPLIDAAFPGVVKAGELDRTALRDQVFADPQAKIKLEAIIHPLVQQKRQEFLSQAEAAGENMVILDVPLLFEVGGNTVCDHVIVVSADAGIQRQRVLERDGMTPAAFDAILANQMSDADKRARADFVIDTGKGLNAAQSAVDAIINQFKS